MLIGWKKAKGQIGSEYWKVESSRCIQWHTVTSSPGAKLENGGLPYTDSPLSFHGFN